MIYRSLLQSTGVLQTHYYIYCSYDFKLTHCFVFARRILFMALCSLVEINLCFGGTHHQNLLKIWVVGSSETSGNTYQATQPHVPKACTLHSHLHENLKSLIQFIGLCKFNCVLQCDKMLTECLINTNIHFWSGLKHYSES